MANLRRTLIIGLGGTGFRSILDAKKMFIENYGEVPPMIGFLGIDTDEPGLKNAFVISKDGKKIGLSNSEQLAITVSDPRTIYERNLNTNLFDWMPADNVGGLDQLTIGAGQMRSNGRFAITVNERKVLDVLTNKLHEVNDAMIIDNPKYGLLGAETEVHVVFSLGGGTGSGTFLNLAYLIRRLMPNVKLSGYAVLGDVFRSMASGAMTAKVRPNSKGALIDLDYLAHLDANSEAVELKWLRDIDKIKHRPFDALYLLDNRNENNDTFTTVDPICEMISLAIVTSVGELGVALDSVSDNVSKLISDGAMDIKDKKAWIASFGCSEIIFDGNRLANIYASKACIQLVNCMLNGGCDDPSLIANSWIDENKIRENQNKDDVIDYFMQKTPRYIFSDLDSPDNPLPESENYIANRGVESQSELDSKLEELKSKIDASLTKLMYEQANRECGVYLCQQILLSILHQVEICDGEMKQEKEEFENNLPRYESSLTSACNELKDTMTTFFKIGKKDKIEEVVGQTMILATQKREIERRKYARLFYNWLRVRIGQSIDRVNVIIRNLEEVRNACNSRIETLLMEGRNHSFFQFDLSSEIGEKINCPFTDIVFNNFILDIKAEGGVTAICGMDSKQTYDLLMRFATSMPQADSYRKMTVDEQLDSLSDEEIKRLLQRAIHKSYPLLPFTYRGWEAELKERPVEFYNVGIPNKKESRLVKDNLFQRLVPGAESVQFSETGLGNRIIIYRQLGVVPTFTIKSIDNYNSEYEKWESSKHHGSHWDDKLCVRMEKERFKLDPSTGLSRNFFESWVNAIIYDLITYNQETGQYQIKSRGLGGKPLRGWLIDMGASRKEALAFLEDNYEILEGEIKSELNKMDIPGPDNQLKIKSKKAGKAAADGSYYAEVSKCPIPFESIMHYPDEEKIIGDEIEFLLSH